jgi:hypothetical protein
MEDRSNGDRDDFGWVQGEIIRGLRAEGFHADHLSILETKTTAISDAIRAFHDQRQALAASGRYSARGLSEVLQDLAVRTAADVRRLLDDTHLKNNIKQVRDTLKPVKMDPMESLTRLWRLMEIRQLYASEGLATGDTIKGRQAFYEAQAAGDVDAMEALSTWPRQGVLPPELKAEVRRVQEEARDPLTAQKLRDLEALQAQWDRLKRDALQALPLPQADPVAEVARGEASSVDATT